MPSKLRSTSSTISSFKLKTLGAAVISALVLSNAYAAGLGKLTVLSSLGQPLRAEIELTSVAADEAGSLVPRLASADAFRQANIDLNPALLSLRFAVEQRGSAQYIRVTSTQPMNEPFVDMLLELGGSKGRLVREYTFLLDPPELRNQQAAQVGSTPAARSLPPVVSQSQQAPRASASVAETVRQTPVAPPVQRQPRAERAPAPAAVPKAEPAEGASEYEVKKGDSLAKIAGQFRSEGVSLDQMLVALYRNNPDAFVGKNMNRLRAGQILSVPSADDAKSTSQSEASGVVLAQAADFNSYRNKLAGQVATAAPKESDESRQTSGGKITTKVQEQTGGTESKDKLKLSKSGAGQSANDKAVGLSAEDAIAKDKAIAEANARVKELEKNVTDLQKLLEIKNRDLADQQKQAETAKATAPVAAATPAAAPVASAPAAAPVPASTVAAETAPAAPASAVVAEPVSAVAAAPVAPPVAKPKRTVVAPPPPPPETSFLEDLTGNPLFLPGAATLLALLAGLGIYSARRRKQPVKSFEDSIITDSTLKSNSLFGSTGGQSVDTNNSVFNSNFVPSASQLDTNEVDPIAEADVYIAYGRDAQAEEILKEALRNQPDRHAVRVKLLEIYANRKDVRSFETLATELYGLTKGQGDEWQQAANLGAILDPSNPLYSSGVASDEFASKASALTAPTRPMDEATMDELLATTEAKEPGEAADTIETSPYFGSTTLLAEDALNPPPKSEPAPVMEPAADSKSDVEDLDFDLEGLELESSKKDEPEALPGELPADVASIDFDFLDKKPDAPLVEKDEPSDLADLSFDLSDEPKTIPAPASAPEVLVPEAMGLDFPSSNPSSSSDTPFKPAEDKLPEFDLSDIELDLDPAPSATTSTPTVADSPLDLPALEGLNDEEPYTSNAEMATKLDLAIAYQEIGDKEGARELLEEVVKGGDPDQIDKAKNLLNKLA